MTDERKLKIIVEYLEKAQVVCEGMYAFDANLRDDIKCLIKQILTKGAVK